MKKSKKLISAILLCAMLCSLFAASAFAESATSCKHPNAYAGEHVSAKAPTCVDEGNLEYYVCPGCQANVQPSGTSATIIDPVLPATGVHTPADEPVNAKEASYTEEGYTGDVVCSVCGIVMEEGKVIPKLPATQCDHSKATDRDHFDAKAPTCTEAGNVEYTACPDCGMKFEGWSDKALTDEEVVISALGHTEELIGAKAASYTEEGYTGDLVCSVCGEVLKKGEVIPMLAITDCDHGKATDRGHFDAKAPTCTEAGNVEYTVCPDCGMKFEGWSDKALTDEELILPALGHTPAAERKGVKEASYTEEGYTGDVVCSVCGEVLEKGEAIAKLHSDSALSDPSKPKTGDENSAGTWLATMLFSGLFVAGTIVILRKTRYIPKHMKF